jgi:hypothetical protein
MDYLNLCSNFVEATRGRSQMKINKCLWSILFVAFFLILLIPATREVFLGFSGQHHYIGGFIKFFILATFGEVVGLRIITERWDLPHGAIYRAFVWGCLGVAVTLFFSIFSGGVEFAQQHSYLPGGDIYVLTAFLISLLMNLSFGPVLMTTHRVTDTYIDLRLEGKKNVNMKMVLDTINWPDFNSFVILKTIPFFWVPAHTIVFIAPSQFRVLLAALLSVALGGILAFAKKK